MRMVLPKRRGILALAAALAVAFSLSGCAGGAKASSAPTAAQAALGEKRTVTIFGSSDIHGYFLPWDYATDAAYPTGGLSKIATVVARERAANPNVVLVDAGDLIQGNFAEGFKAEKENPMMKGLNAIGYDVFVPGNHEFNFGMPVLNATLKAFKGKVLGGNIYTNAGKPFLPAYAILERGGVKIGVIGMTTPMTMEFEAKSDHLKGIEIRDPVADTKAAIAALKGKVDVIVGVMHMGEADENGVPDTGVTDIIKAAPGLDVVFAGHMHLRLAGKTIGETLVVEPYVYAQNLSRVDLSFERTASGWKLVDRKPTLVALAAEVSDPALEKVYAPYHEKLRADANSVVGAVVGGDLVARDAVKGIPTVQVEDTPLVTLFSDACLYYSKAEVVSLQIDNNAARLDRGDIKRKDIAFNYQYALGEITNYRFTGAELKAYMEWSADYFNSLKPGDVTVSFNPVRRASKYSTNDFFAGVSYTIDLTKPYGDRVQGLKFADGRTIGPDTSLVLGMNSYRLAQLVGKGGCLEGKTFKPLTDTKTVFGEDDGIIRALIVRYIKEVKKGVVEARCDNNWKLVGLDPSLERERKIVEALVNSGAIAVPSSKGFTNVASINVAGKVAATQAEYDALVAKVQAALEAAATDEAKAAAKADLELIKALKTF